MRIHENLRASRLFLIAALIAAALSACSTKRQQPDANANAAAQPSAQLTASEAKAKPARAVPSAEASTRKTSASVLAQIHQANLKEIALGQIAEEKASTDEVRAYAVQLVNDHTSADQMVLATAQKTGTHLRSAATTQSKTDQKLSSASGAQFDRLFLEQTSTDHKKLMSELQQEREDASDDNIESLIDKIMPILQQHHDLAQILLKKEQALAGPSQNHG
jgi:putative membrane protein